MKKIIIIAAMFATSTAAVAADKEFTSRDKNNDGKLSVQEWIGFHKNATNPEWIARRTKTHQRLDKNSDGQISAAEWTARKG
jgi:Ca2+-binding EF-hand superfamily protein